MIESDAFDESVEVLRVAGQALSRRGQPLIEKDVVALVGLGPDLGQQLAQAPGAGAHDVVPPTLEEDRVPRLVHHLGRKEDFDLGRGGRPYKRRQGGRDAFLAVEEEPMGPEGRLPVQLV